MLSECMTLFEQMIIAGFVALVATTIYHGRALAGIKATLDVLVDVMKGEYDKHRH